MQTLFNRFDLFIRFGLFDVPARPGVPDRFDDGRDNWVGLISATGLCALLVSDFISLL